MEIRVINSNGELVNISNMAIVSTSGRWIIGIDNSGESTRIERFKSDEDARIGLSSLLDGIKRCRSLGERDILIEIEQKEEEKEEK